MHTASYEFLMKPKESAGCHQTLSTRVGSGDETKASLICDSLLQWLMVAWDKANMNLLVELEF